MSQQPKTLTLASWTPSARSILPRTSCDSRHLPEIFAGTCAALPFSVPCAQPSCLACESNHAAVSCALPPEGLLLVNLTQTVPPPHQRE
eukprot:scaffold4081_cov268-Pinguiococcus_pyrenoidosus.AAC.5